jgi:lipid A 4'-phosphatase
MPVFFLLFALLLVLPVVWPRIDLIASGFFYRAHEGFFLADNPVFTALHWLAYYGARGLGVAFAVLALAAWVRRKPMGGVDAKAWTFLLLALLIGPALIANAGFKDHWGRARPREVTEFDGAAPFSPALVPQPGARRNGSFVSGDGAFGFFLPAFAFVAPKRRSRRVFWGCMGAGTLFGFARLAMGAHFLSDVIYAAFLMLAASSAVHAAMYGRAVTVARWRSWFKRGPTAG